MRLAKKPTEAEANVGTVVAALPRTKICSNSLLGVSGGVNDSAGGGVAVGVSADGCDRFEVGDRDKGGDACLSWDSFVTVGVA